MVIVILTLWGEVRDRTPTWQKDELMWASPRQPRCHWEFLRLDFLLNLLDFYSVLHASILRFLHLSPSLSPAEEFTSKTTFLNGLLQSLRPGMNSPHLRQKHHTAVNKSALRNRALYFIHRNSAMTALPPWRNKEGALTHPVSSHSHFHGLWSDAPLKPTDTSRPPSAKRNTFGVNNFTMLRSRSASRCVFDLWLA